MRKMIEAVPSDELKDELKSSGFNELDVDMVINAIARVAIKNKTKGTRQMYRGAIWTQHDSKSLHGVVKLLVVVGVISGLVYLLAGSMGSVIFWGAVVGVIWAVGRILA